MDSAWGTNDSHSISHQYQSRPFTVTDSYAHKTPVTVNNEYSRLIVVIQRSAQHVRICKMIQLHLHLNRSKFSILTQQYCTHFYMFGSCATILLPSLIFVQYSYITITCCIAFSYLIITILFIQLKLQPRIFLSMLSHFTDLYWFLFLLHHMHLYTT